MGIQRVRRHGGHTVALDETGPTTITSEPGLPRGPRQAPEPGPPRPDATTGETPTPQSADVHPLPRTRAGSTWVAACIAVLILIALIIFIAQNAGSVRISFLALHGRFSLAVALLAAAAAGCLLTLIVGTTRILQLRRSVRRRHGITHHRRPAPRPEPQDPPHEGTDAETTR